MVLALEEHVQRTFLAVLLAEPPPGLQDSDAINGLAVLAVAANAAHVARMMAVALLRAFHPQASAAALLDAPTRWAIDERLLQLATGLLGVAIATSAAGSEGLSPRALSLRGGGSAALTPAAMSPR